MKCVQFAELNESNSTFHLVLHWIVNDFDLICFESTKIKILHFEVDISRLIING